MEITVEIYSTLPQKLIQFMLKSQFPKNMEAHKSDI